MTKKELTFWTQPLCPSTDTGKEIYDMYRLHYTDSTGTDGEDMSKTPAPG